MTLKEMRLLGVSHLRIGTDWALREPIQGQFHWEPLDLRIAALHEKDHSILLTLSAKAPDWACRRRTPLGMCSFISDDAFRDYIRAFLIRYRGKIDKVQFANEWDNPQWFPGSAQEYVRLNNILYDMVQKLAPEMMVVLGGITRSYPIYEAFCRRRLVPSYDGMRFRRGFDVQQAVRSRICSNSPVVARVEYVLKNAHYDAVDLHLYDDCENWPIYVDTIHDLTDRPILVTEFGGPSSEYEVYSQNYHAQRLAKYIQTLCRLPVTEAYYFSLVDKPAAYHQRTGLLTYGGRRKKAYRVFRSRAGLSAPVRP